MPTSDFQFDARQVSKDDAILNVSGDLSIENSEILRDKFLGKGMTSNKITVVLGNVRNIDLSCIQLLIALIQHRNKANKQTYVEFDLDTPTLELLEKTGTLKTIYSLQSKN